jgi:hypothetical protein
MIVINTQQAIQACMAFRTAALSAWKVLENHGVSVEKLEEVKVEIEKGNITRREGWIKLGLPEREFPG